MGERCNCNAVQSLYCAKMTHRLKFCPPAPMSCIARQYCRDLVSKIDVNIWF